jgi:hypothetical protein
VTDQPLAGPTVPEPRPGSSSKTHPTSREAGRGRVTILFSQARVEFASWQDVPSCRRRHPGTSWMQLLSPPNCQRSHGLDARLAATVTPDVRPQRGGRTGRHSDREIDPQAARSVYHKSLLSNNLRVITILAARPFLSTSPAEFFYISLTVWR